MKLVSAQELHNKNLSTWAEIDLNAVLLNYKEIKRIAGKRTEVLCVVKGDAYGHGMLRIASMLEALGLGFFGVSDIQEGILLRKNGIKNPILLFESTLPAHAVDIVDYNLTPSVCTWNMAVALNHYAQIKGRKVDVHIEVDTGMGRMGVWHEDAVTFIKKVHQLFSLSMKGLFTHFPMAETNPPFTRNQVHSLYELIKKLDRQGIVIPYIHAANSMGLAGYKTRILNLARPGLMLYGLSSSPRMINKARLKPVLSVKSKIVFVKEIKRGQGISYGHTFIAPKNMNVATLAIGYKDGYLRCLSNKSSVLINGVLCPVLGRVTMDQMMVDVSRVPSVRTGMTAVVLGRQNKKNISADELAGLADTISYEIVCSLGNHLPRVYKSSGEKG